MENLNQVKERLLQDFSRENNRKRKSTDFYSAMIHSIEWKFSMKLTELLNLRVENEQLVIHKSITALAKLPYCRVMRIF